MPKTRFKQGIVRGKLMAKEYPGILLCIAAVLRSSAGRALLLRKKPGTFGKDGVLKDWSLLVETLLQWEMWLKSDTMTRNHVELAQHRHRHIMYFVKKVGRRVEGMGLKISKFHGISHMADDTLVYESGKMAYRIIPANLTGPVRLTSVPIYVYTYAQWSAHLPHAQHPLFKNAQMSQMSHR